MIIYWFLREIFYIVSSVIIIICVVLSVSSVSKISVVSIFIIVSSIKCSFESNVYIVRNVSIVSYDIFLNNVYI